MCENLFEYYRIQDFFISLQSLFRSDLCSFSSANSREVMHLLNNLFLAFILCSSYFVIQGFLIFLQLSKITSEKAILYNSSILLLNLSQNIWICLFQVQCPICKRYQLAKMLRFDPNYLTYYCSVTGFIRSVVHFLEQNKK